MIHLLVLLLLIGFVLAQISSLGEIRYLPTATALLGMFFLGKQVFLPRRRGYVIGGGLILLGMVVGTLAEGNARSYFYVVFAVLIFFFFPLFAKKITHPFVLAVVTSFLLLTLIPLGQEGGRVASWYGNSNVYSGVVLCSVFFVGLSLHRRPVLQFFGFLILGGAVVLGESRTVVGCMLLFLALYYYQRYVSHRVINRRLFALWVLMIGLYVTMVTDDRFAIVTAIQQNQLSDKNERGLSHRDELFYVSLDIIKANPLGVGMGRSNAYVEKRVGIGLSPHNAYLKTAMEGGLIMLLGFVILIGWFLLTTKSILAASFIVAMLLRALFESSVPFSLSLTSAVLVLPMFLNEYSLSSE